MVISEESRRYEAGHRRDAHAMRGVEDIRAYGLDRISRAELTEFLHDNYPDLPEDAVRFQQTTRAEKYGEPATMVVILSVIAFKAFVSWLALRPRNKRITQSLDIRLPDGTSISTTLDVTVPESGEVKPELVKELLSLEGLTPDAVDELKRALAS
jgi:hypothetical protein